MDKKNAPPLPPETIREMLRAALDSLGKRPLTPGLEIYERDRHAFLSSAESLGQPHLVSVGGVPVRYLTPLYWGHKIGGLVASEPTTGEVLSWPAWGPGLKPLFLRAPEELDRLIAARDPRVNEFIPRSIKTPSQFAVDPKALRHAFLLEHYQSLPFKNQEERVSWVEEINRSGRMKTRWRYRPGSQEPAYKCLSLAASTVVDWWGLMYGHPVTNRYQNFVNGMLEYGVNPRELEVLYYHRARSRGRPYKLVPRTPLTLDPVTRERIPSSSRGYAHLISSQDERTLPDPLTRDGLPVYRYHPGMYHMDGPPRVLFKHGKSDADAIKDALHRHGIVLAFTQTRVLRYIRVGLHGIPIVGYFDRGGETVFIYHESYGNNGPGYIWDDLGGPAYMSIPAKLLREASCFPHRLWIDAEPAGDFVSLSITHSGGGSVPGVTVESSGTDGEPLGRGITGGGPLLLPAPTGNRRLTITARREFFLKEDGGAFTAELHGSLLTRGGLALALTRWLCLSRQLEEKAVTYQPPHVMAGLQALEQEIAATLTRETGPEAILAGLHQELLPPESFLLRNVLVPRLRAEGVPGDRLAALRGPRIRGLRLPDVLGRRV